MDILFSYFWFLPINSSSPSGATENNDNDSLYLMSVNYWTLCTLYALFPLVPITTFKKVVFINLALQMMKRKAKDIK